MKYDEYMDKECIPICDALNELPDVRTFESCCGHLQRRYVVYLYTDNPYSMAVVARTFDRRYLYTKSTWKVTIETIDVERTPQFCIGIYSKEPFKDYDTMMQDVNEVVESINYWKQPEFYDHFKFNKYNKDAEVIKDNSEQADSHPRNCLVDIEKACEWIEENIDKYIFTNRDWNAPQLKEEFFDSFRKAMEE